MDVQLCFNDIPILHCGHDYISSFQFPVVFKRLYPLVFCELLFSVLSLMPRVFSTVFSGEMHKLLLGSSGHNMGPC
jgi:hypothetical protein